MDITLINQQGQESQIKLADLMLSLSEQAKLSGQENFQSNNILEKVQKYLEIIQMGAQKNIGEDQLSELLANISAEENYPNLANYLRQNPKILLSTHQTEQLNFSRYAQEKLKKIYLPATLQNTDIHSLIKQLSSSKTSGALADKIRELIVQGVFLPHQNILKEKRAFSHMQLNLKDNLSDIFDQLKQAAINFQNLTSSTINFSAIRPKMSVVKSTQSFSSGPVSFIKIYASTFEALRQNISSDFTPIQIFILNINHPDILEYLIFIKNFQKNSLNKHLEFLIELTPNFLEALNREEDFELINPENEQTVNLLSAKNTFDLIVSTILENPALGLTTTNSSQTSENQTSLSGLINLAAYSENTNLPEKILIDLENIQTFLINQTNSTPSPSATQIKIQFTGWSDFLIKQNIAFGSVASLEIAEKIFSAIREKVQPDIKLEIDLRSPLLAIIESSRGLEALDQLVSTKTNLDGQEIYQIHPLLKEKLNSLGLTNSELIKQIQESNSLAELYQIPVSIKSLFQTNGEIPPTFHLEFQRNLEKLLDGTIEKKIYFENSLDLEKIKAEFLREIQSGIRSIKLCQFDSLNKTENSENQSHDKSFLLNIGQNKRRRHREIQPPLFQIKKTEEITLPPIST
jgi:ribonucleoside-diphosphate reductase alpha chain